jgi:ribonuclease D
MEPGARGALRSLAAWRERRAMQRNRPRRWILTDEALLDVAAAAPLAMARLRENPGVAGLLKAGCGDEIVAAVAAGVAQPLPPPTAALTADQREAVKQLATAVRECAIRMNMTPALLTNRKQLEQMVRGERDLSVLSNWRLEVIGNELLGRLEGRSPTL